MHVPEGAGVVLEDSAASVVSLWELLAGSFPAWFLMGCQALFHMWPIKRGLFCLVARPEWLISVSPTGDAELSWTLLRHPVLAAVCSALRSPFCPPFPCVPWQGLTLNSSLFAPVPPVPSPEGQSAAHPALGLEGAAGPAAATRSRPAAGAAPAQGAGGDPGARVLCEMGWPVLLALLLGQGAAGEPSWRWCRAPAQPRAQCPGLSVAPFCCSWSCTTP